MQTRRLPTAGRRAPSLPERAARAAGWLFACGIAVFSGSLYALALSGVRPLGALAPLGGLALIGGWAALGLAAWRDRG